MQLIGRLYRSFDSGEKLAAFDAFNKKTRTRPRSSPFDEPRHHLWQARGASGGVVTALQKGLKKYSTPATDPGAVDGDFGPKTEAVVKAYQQDRGVQADGIVGDQTWWAPAGAAGATLASLSRLTTV